MNEELKKNLLEEIEKSGFPLELSVVEKLRKAELVVFPNLNFADEDERPREIDAFVMMPSENQGIWPYGLIGLNLIIECKSSHKRPWVFFQDATDPSNFVGLVDRLECMTDVEVKKPYMLLAGCQNTILRQHHYNSIDIPKARTYFEAFGKDAGKEIYQAVTSIWYTLDFQRRLFKKSGSKIIESSKRRTIFLHGVIVYKGILVVATREEDKFELRETPHIVLRTTDCLTNKDFPFAPQRETVIDVVHEDYLEQYISICKNDLKLCVDHLLQIANAGWVSGNME